MKEKNNNQTIPKVNIPEHQIKYANLLLYGAWASIAALLITFYLYVSNTMPAFIPPSEMPLYWTMSSSEFLNEVGLRGGWEWTGMLGKGDYVNFIGIAFLAGLTIIGYLSLLLPAYIKKKDKAYTTIVIVEILVLIIAASGILGSAGH